jgi:hypothetical protein
MTPRGTDWSLAALVALAATTGALTIFAGGPGDAWVFTLHGAGGLLLGGVVVVKLRRVWHRLRPGAGIVAALLVTATLVSGIAWASGADVVLSGFRLLFWHDLIGALLAAVVLSHAVVRAKRPRRRDLADRRQLFLATGAAAAAYAAWRVQDAVAPGRRRRFTGSYARASFSGNDFPVTSWIADDPRPLTIDALDVDGRAVPLRDLDRGDELVATLDCTGGFHTTQRWRGARLFDLLGDTGDHSHVRVISHTGYRASFALDDAHDLLLATHVGDEPLSHGHGSPVRLVAPGRRGWQWVKWVTKVELHDGPDPAALASTVWSSFTPEGRGDA